MKHLDLFSGIGGFALACSWVWGDEYENVGHSDIEPYACKVYHKHFPGSPCLGDITKIEWQEGQADLITGGFPCQPHSVAGKRKGEDDSRDLWSECARAVRIVRPRFAVFENVPGLFVSNGGRFFNRVMSDLAAIGYACEWQVLSAAAVGAPHRRERVWIVAYADGNDKGIIGGGISCAAQEIRGRASCGLFTGRGEVLADTERAGLERCAGEELRGIQSSARSGEMADTGCEGILQRGEPEDVEPQRGKPAGVRRDGVSGGGMEEKQTMAHGDESRLQGRDKWQRENGHTWSGSWPNEGEWFAQSSMGRVAHGVPARVDRLKGLGNAIVPQVAYEILLPLRKFL